MRDVKVYADLNKVDQKAIDQVDALVKEDAFKDSKVRIMPDVHPGTGCVVGFTADLGDKVIPNIVGVDIGCGVLVSKLKNQEIDYKKLDTIIRLEIPSGREVNVELSSFEYDKSLDFVDRLRCKKHLRNLERMVCSMASLGGGNHFIEIGEDSEYSKYLIVHTGSRNLGLQVCNYYQSLAIRKSKYYNDDDRRNIVEKLKSEGRQLEISSALKKIPTVSKEFAYLEGQDRDDYLHDMKICQNFAMSNRIFIAMRISKAMKLYPEYTFQSVHNYIDDKNMVRKGAISAHRDEKLIIPINMRDGCILGEGKGNIDWNESAPHGAGRLLSRSDAKRSLLMKDFKEDTKKIYTTSVNESTLDESPRAYRSLKDIINRISPTVDVLDILRTTYNFKGGE